jgi:hypothetical protein
MKNKEHRFGVSEVDLVEWLKQLAQQKNMPIQLVHRNPDALEGSFTSHHDL